MTAILNWLFSLVALGLFLLELGMLSMIVWEVG